ncbi:MAG: hypothetical protein ABIL09_29215 [Gemmatimonadota bacterium]
MTPATPLQIPQVLSVTKLARSRRLTLGKLVRQHLGLAPGAPACLSMDAEVRLSAQAPGTEVPTGRRGDLVLPQPAVDRLGLTPGQRLALIQRDHGVALKRVVAAAEPGGRARLVDRESADMLARVAITNPMPEVLVPQLSQRYREAKLRHDVTPWLTSDPSLEGWCARQLRQRPAPADGGLRQEMIAQRRSGQQENGSWGADLALTARHLRELALLGLDRADPAVERGAQWLLARPESPYNPGMLFASDELVARQIEIADGRSAGGRGRFREIRKPEQRAVMAGDDLIRMPCGPRLMWPNALALEALLAVGCEGEDRVQRALALMSSREWCECGYQHGLADWRTSEPMSAATLDAFEAHCQQQYRYGGIPALDRLLTSDDPKGPAGPPRVSRTAGGDGDEYVLRMNVHIQGCEFVTTRALSRVRDRRMLRFAAAHLWRFAGHQHADDGRFGPEKYGTGYDQAGILETFARYDHPVTPVVILRSLPWIIDSQNEDGTWGSPDARGSATLAVLAALASVGPALPDGLRVTD